MRRLYSTFAGGWPGIGLLLMRVICGSVIILRAYSIPSHDHPASLLLFVACSLSGILLIPGLWTPIVGSFIAFLEAFLSLAQRGEPFVALLLGTLGASLAMLGPGLWSVDALLFGWKRIEAPARTKSDARYD